MDITSDSGEDQDALKTIIETIEIHTTAGLTDTIKTLASNGTIKPNTRLPTVRKLASHLSMSRSAVAKSWTELGRLGVVDTKQRGGTILRGPAVSPRARRYESMVRSTKAAKHDLGNLRSDGISTADIRNAFERAVTAESINSPFPEAATEGLIAALKPTWPFPASHYVATHGGPDGLDLFLKNHVRRGDRVIVESPTYARVLDQLDARFVEAIPVERTSEGIDLEHLAAALSKDPAAMVYQPHLAIPDGMSHPRHWFDNAAELLGKTSIPILEYNPLSLWGEPSYSLGVALPDQVVQIQSFAFFFGHDVRVALIGGAQKHIQHMRLSLTYSSRYVSRIMQLALANLLTDAGTQAHTNTLVAESQRRRDGLVDALNRRGFNLKKQPGTTIWLPVPDEHSVAVRLAPQGVILHPGSYHYPTGLNIAQINHPARMLLNASNLKLGFDEAAQIIADACEIP